jgi:hypothetical protein
MMFDDDYWGGKLAIGTGEGVGVSEEFGLMVV